MISKEYSEKKPVVIPNPPYEPPTFHQIKPEDYKLEVRMIMIRIYLKRLTRGNTASIIINVYLPEFIPTKQKALIYQLIGFIKPTIKNLAKNGKPLIYKEILTMLIPSH